MQFSIRFSGFCAIQIYTCYHTIESPADCRAGVMGRNNHTAQKVTFAPGGLYPFQCSQEAAFAFFWRNELAKLGGVRIAALYQTKCAKNPSKRTAHRNKFGQPFQLPDSFIHILGLRISQQLLKQDGLSGMRLLIEDGFVTVDQESPPKLAHGTQPITRL
jgi:hypothetical protein